MPRFTPLPLQAGVYSNSGTADVIRWIDDPVRVGVRCSLPGWLETIEITERRPSYHAVDWSFERDFGKRLALFDPGLRCIVDGWIMEIIPDGLHVHIRAKGGWKLMQARYYDGVRGTDYTNTTQADALAEDVLSVVSRVSTNYSNIVGPTTAVGSAWDNPQGTVPYKPTDIISDILNWSDSNNAIYDFYLRSQGLSSAWKLQYPIAHLEARSPNSQPWVVFNREDLRDRQELSSHIYDLTTRVKTYYVPVTNVKTTAAAGATTLEVNSLADFSTPGHMVSIYMDNGEWWDVVINGTSGSYGMLLNDPLPYAATAGNIVRRVDPRKATSYSTNATAEALYWQSELIQDMQDMNATQAQQYQDAYLDVYGEPVKQRAYTMSTPAIRGINGSLAPLYVLIQRPFKFRFGTRYPAGGLDSVLGGHQSEYVTAIDYDGRSVRIVTALPDARLDAILYRKGITDGESVQRGPTPSRPVTDYYQNEMGGVRRRRG